MSLLLSASTLINNTINLKIFIINLTISFVIIIVSILAKKLAARAIDAKSEIKIWQFKRYWITTRSEFKKPVPMGVILPILLSFISLGFIKFLAFFQTELEAMPSRVAKKYGLRRYSDIMEWDGSLVVFYSTLALLILAVICSFITSKSFSFFELAKYSLYYSIYNIIPFSSLDGVKLFMGSKPLYVFTLILIAITALIIFL